MSTTSSTTDRATPAETQGLARIVAEGYGPGAWHGPDLKAAVADVTPDGAFRRPAPGRHNVAEIALHHAYCVRGAYARLSGRTPEPFVLEGDDWFALDGPTRLPWPQVLATLEREQARVHAFLTDLDAGRVASPLATTECRDLALGICCHAVYHAGQMQLVKKLVG